MRKQFSFHFRVLHEGLEVVTTSLGWLVGLVKEVRPLWPSQEQETQKQEIAPGGSDGRTGACRGVAVMSAVSPDTDNGVPIVYSSGSLPFSFGLLGQDSQLSSVSSLELFDIKC